MFNWKIGVMIFSAGARKIFAYFLEKDEHDETANNRRWLWLLAVAVVTTCIALEKHGAPLLMSTWYSLRYYIIGGEHTNWLGYQFRYFLFGNSASPMAIGQASAPAPWTWWWMADMLWVAVWVYGPVAFHKELLAMFTKFMEKSHEHHERISKEREVKNGAAQKKHEEDVARWEKDMAAYEQQQKQGVRKGQKQPEPPPKPKEPEKSKLPNWVEIFMATLAGGLLPELIEVFVHVLHGRYRKSSTV